MARPEFRSFQYIAVFVPTPARRLTYEAITEPVQTSNCNYINTHFHLPFHAPLLESSRPKEAKAAVKRERAAGHPPRRRGLEVTGLSLRQGRGLDSRLGPEPHTAAKRGLRCCREAASSATPRGPEPRAYREEAEGRDRRSYCGSVPRPKLQRAGSTRPFALRLFTKWPPSSSAAEAKVRPPPPLPEVFLLVGTFLAPAPN